MPIANPLPVGIFSRIYHSFGNNVDGACDFVLAGMKYVGDVLSNGGSSDATLAGAGSITSPRIASSAQIIPGMQRTNIIKISRVLFFMICPSFKVSPCLPPHLIGKNCLNSSRWSWSPDHIRYKEDASEGYLKIPPEAS